METLCNEYGEVTGHACGGLDDDGQPIKPEKVTCGNCGAEWCERCDPFPSAMCPVCNGYGYSKAPMNDIAANGRDET